MPGAVLREAFDYRFSRLDPTGAHIDPPSVALYEPLVVKGSDWQAYGLLASRWTTSTDGLEWRFFLRPGLRFHSGDPCDAEAVIRAFEFLRYGAFESGGQLWYWDPVDTVTAEGPAELVVRLHHPYARLPSLLWGTHTAVYNEARRAADPERFGHALADGTGPYRLVSWSEERIVAERWPDYQPPPAPFLRGNDAPPDRIEWSAILDPAERLDAVESGRVHVIHAPPLAEVDRLASEGTLRVVEFAQQSNVYLTVDFRRTDLRFDDVRLRRALSLAIDREALVRNVLHGHGAAARRDPARGRALRPAARRTLPVRSGRGRAPHGRPGVHRLARRRAGDRRRAPGGAMRLPGRRGAAPAGRGRARRPASGRRRPRGGAGGAVRAVLHRRAGRSSGDDLEVALARSDRRAHRVHRHPRRRGGKLEHASLPALDSAFDEWLQAPHDGLARAAARVQSVVADELPYIPLVTPNDVWVSAPQLDGYLPYQANLYPLYQPVQVAQS